MLKLEIKMDESKIEADQKYQAECIYQALESAFSRYSLNKIVQQDGTLCFVGNGDPKDYGAFGSIITSLKEKVWFMDYEEDFVAEDVLYHYTKKMSAA